MDELTKRLIGLPSHSVDPEDRNGSLRKKWNPIVQKSGEYGLLSVQAAALEVASQLRDYPGVGGYVQIKVGGGKTLLALLLASLYDDVDRPMLLLPPDLVEELEGEIFKWHRHFHMKVPSWVPFSKLSQPSSSGLLREYSPDLIIIDESQNLANATAARTKRFLRYMEENPKCRIFCMTGTITDQSIKEYAHLLRLSIGPLCPVPSAKAKGRPNPTFSKWRAVLDKNGRPSWNDVNSFRDLANHYRVPWDSSDIDVARDAARKAYYHRLRSTYGVMLTQTSSAKTPLHIEILEPDFGGLKDAVKEVEETWILPNGDEVVDGIEMARHLSTLSVGFYNRWDWDAVDADSEWNMARLGWSCAVRAYLKDHAREGCDSPALVERWVRAGEAGAALTGSLERWDAVRELEAPPTVAMWLTYDVLQWAKEWVNAQTEPTILWYHSRAVGQKLPLFGVQTKTEKPKPNPKKLPRVALPISVFHKGHNMQGYRRHLVIEPRSSGKITEQLLGRAHRGGQDKDVHFHLLGWSDKQRGQIEESVERALYAQKTTGQEQKLLLAQWTNSTQTIDKVLRRAT